MFQVAIDSLKSTFLRSVSGNASQDLVDTDSRPATSVPSPNLHGLSVIPGQGQETDLDYDDEDGEDVLDIHPLDNEQEELDADKQAVQVPSAQSLKPVQASGLQPVLPSGLSDTSSQLRTSEQDPEAWTYHELINSVYDTLPTNHCPPQPPPIMKVRSITEDLVGETVHQAPCLPHSSTVKATATYLSELEGFLHPKKGFTVPASAMRSLSAPSAYTVHSEQWPVKAPQLDSDASKLGIPATPHLHTTWQFVESQENKVRNCFHLVSRRSFLRGGADGGEVGEYGRGDPSD